MHSNNMNTKSHTCTMYAREKVTFFPILCHFSFDLTRHKMFKIFALTVFAILPLDIHKVPGVFMLDTNTHTLSKI